jgi:3-hydroxyisobutyrate dehydrogenase-like beta-hydroxyacid dehydrogenase
VLKDLSYVLELASQTGTATHVTRLAARYYTATARHGWSGRYFPSVIEVIDRNIGPAPADEA